jgi:hypothetical protein
MVSARSAAQVRDREEASEHDGQPHPDAVGASRADNDSDGTIEQPHIDGHGTGPIRMGH